MKRLIIREKGQKVYDFIVKYVGPSFKNTLVLSTTTAFNIENQPDDTYDNLVNLRRINDIRRINRFLAAVNDKIPIEGLFICCVETKSMRKKRIFGKFPPVINFLYYLIDFIWKRVFPKLKVTGWFYFALTGGRNRVLSKTEVLGRLYYSGFEYVSEKVIDKNLYLVVRKVKESIQNGEPSYGPIFRMKRVGKEGKTIYVYKVRTMHAYSEFLQQFIFERYKLQDGGKFKNDIRVTTLGKLLRKFWLDEIPMVINVFKGEIKLVGVRPLSEHYLSLYTKELQEKRFKHKPGLVPPFYADLPKTLDEIMASEMRYLEAYEKRPFTTDFKYFFRAFYNIVIKRARSK